MPLKDLDYKQPEIFGTQRAANTVTLEIYSFPTYCCNFLVLTVGCVLQVYTGMNLKVAL